MGGRKHYYIILALCLAALLMIAALNEDLLVREYIIETHRVKDNVRLAVISDLHETRYGQPEEEQDPIIQILREHMPDAVCITGDLLDGKRDEEPAWDLIERMTVEFDCYYVTGNHEFWSGKSEEYIRRLEDAGVTVLRGEGAELSAGSGRTQFQLFGVDDPDGVSEEEWQAQLDACRRAAGTGTPDETLSVLLTHRPERVSDYQGFELIIAGHAHGGQARIPGILNGLYAPNQGVFPGYAGGKYSAEDGTMIVSRGMVRDNLPRIFNRPELVIIDILPPETDREARIS